MIKAETFSETLDHNFILATWEDFMHNVSPAAEVT
jgi:hypothetical protein